MRGFYGVTASLLVLAAASPAWAQAVDSKSWHAPEQTWLVYTVILIVLGGSLLALLFIRSALGASEWSLADALSEDTELTAMVTNAQGQREPKVDAQGKPVMVTEMRASSSRLIALMGMMVIMLMFLGFGTFALYSFAYTGSPGTPENIKQVIYFLVGGMTLFAPYVVNKFSSIFENLTPKR